MILAPFSVVLTPFPFADRLVEKLRPAVIVSRPDLLTDAGVVWLAMITSSSRALNGDVEVSDPDAAGVRTACRVRTAKIATVDPRRILDEVGVLPAKDSREVLRFLTAHLARPRN